MTHDICYVYTFLSTYGQLQHQTLLHNKRTQDSIPHRGPTSFSPTKRRDRMPIADCDPLRATLTKKLGGIISLAFTRFNLVKNIVRASATILGCTRLTWHVVNALWSCSSNMAFQAVRIQILTYVVLDFDVRGTLRCNGLLSLTPPNLSQTKPY